jgi:hypothetical protein
MNEEPAMMFSIFFDIVMMLSFRMVADENGWSKIAGRCLLIAGDQGNSQAYPHAPCAMPHALFSQSRASNSVHL